MSVHICFQNVSSFNQHTIALPKFKMYVKYKSAFGESLFILLQCAVHIAKTDVIFEF